MGESKTLPRWSTANAFGISMVTALATASMLVILGSGWSRDRSRDKSLIKSEVKET
jgi:hypothetical protein